MSQENVEIVRRMFEAFNEGGPEAVIGGGFLSSEFVLDASPSGIPGLGVYRGIDQARAAFEDDWFKAFPHEEWEVGVGELIDHGDQVIATTQLRGRGASSRVTEGFEGTHIATVRDGEIVRLDSHRDRAKALKAAGLSE